MSELARRDDGLVSRCRTGDLEAFEQVYARWERSILLHAYSMLQDADDADDVKQETFLRAFRSFSSFDGRCALHTWLFGICSNLCRDRIKQRSRRPVAAMGAASEERTAENRSGDPMEAVLVEADQELILQALSSLPPNQKELLLLREVEGMTYEEIRDVYRCSLASVKLRLFRARQQWRKRYMALADEGEAL